MNSKEREQTAPLDHWIELFKKYSLFGSLFVGTAMAMLYFLGIAIYATCSSVLGVPPFDFSLQKCLEFGGSSFVLLLTVMPLLILAGLVDNLKEASVLQYAILLLPLILLFVIRYFKGRTSKWIARVRKISNWILLLFVGFLMVLFYVTFLSTYQTVSLLINPAINTLIEHRQELLQNFDLRSVGLPQMDHWTANLVIHDENWMYGKIGAMYSMNSLLLVYGILAIRVSGQYHSNFQADGSKPPKWFGYLKRSFITVFVVYLLGTAFTVPARTVALCSLRKAKVDVVIKGLEDVTSRYYLLLVGEYSDHYAFYLPNKQDVLMVQKSRVDVVRILENESIFADRGLFVKAPTK